MTDEVKEQEVWKQYPKYSFIEVNQFGEVRTRDRYVSVKGGSKRLVKGRVLKQWQTRDGYLFAHFSVNGKFIHLYVHRIVATCFVPNPDNLPEVNHKDNDPTNNFVSNLEWCTGEYNVWYREKYGKSLNRPVVAVNLENGKVFHFKSQCEAARQLSISQGDINNVLKDKLNQVGGYLFVEDKSEITKERI